MPKFWVTFDRQVEREIRQHAELAIEAPSEAEARAVGEAMLANPGQIPWQDIRIVDERIGDPDLCDEIEPADEDEDDGGSLVQNELVELYADANRWGERIKGAHSMEPEIRRMLRDALRVLRRYAWVRMDEEARWEARSAT